MSLNPHHGSSSLKPHHGSFSLILPLISLNGVILVLLCMNEIGSTQCHGRVRSPPSRSSCWRSGYECNPNYSDNQVWCGGRENQIRNGGKCGVCGDDWNVRPREHEVPDGRYVTPLFVTGFYEPGKEMEVWIEVTAPHRGFFEFKLCPATSVGGREEGVEVTQECLDRHPLVVDGEGYRWELGEKGAGNYTMKLSLPRDLSCDRCLLQWTWTTANFNAKCSDGEWRLGCGPQETFRQCSDISVRRGNNNTSGLPSCRGYNAPCEGDHLTQGNCCDGLYCDKPVSDWAQGRCYEQIRSCKKSNSACEGDHMSQGDCCEGLSCYKTDPAWAKGRCYESESTSSSSKEQLVKKGTTTSTPAPCRGYQEPCAGAGGTQAECCDGLYCQKDDPSWFQGWCLKLVNI